MLGLVHHIFDDIKNRLDVITPIVYELNEDDYIISLHHKMTLSLVFSYVVNILTTHILFTGPMVSQTIPEDCL